MQFSFIINNTTLKIAETKLPYTGNVNSYRCVFDITSDIDNLSWFCVFGTNGSYYIQQIMGNACYIPAEVLMSENTIQIGCYATNMAENDYKRISTNWVYLKALEGAYTEGSLPEIPSPDVWETLVSKAIPTIGANGNWYIYDMSLGEYVDTGVKASGGGSGEVDLSNYYNKAETDSLLNKKLTAGVADYYVSQIEVNSQGTIEVRDENDTIQLSIKVPSNSVDSDTNTVDLSAVCTKTEIEAYIEETLLGGAW